MEEISQDIIERAAQDDLNAFEQIFKVYALFVYNVALKIIGNQQEAQEVSQEIFLNIHRKLNKFEQRSSLKTWIYRIAVNLSINYSKKRAREKNKLILAHNDRLQSFANVVESEVITKSEKEYRQILVARLLSKLSVQQRACIVLRNIEGLSYQQIAEILNINVNSVRSRLKRARLKLLSLTKGGNTFEV